MIDIIDSTTGETIETIESVHVAQRTMDAIQRHALVPLHLKESE